MKNNTVGLNEFLQIFEEELTIADINASRYLGKISAAIAKCRIDMKATQKEFSEYLGISQGMVSRWESGDYNFTVRGLAEIAEKLGLELYINLKKYNTKTTEINYPEETDFACIASETKQFVGKSSKILNFRSKTSNMSDENKEIYKIFRNSDRLEM